jgi:glycerophosphoryl diester phosphodiesterase
MLEIFVHRGLLNGIESIVKAVPHYKKLGIGIELDLRMGKNGVYVSHDVIDNGELFEDFCKSFFNSNLRIALHVKEIKVIEEVVRLLKKYSLENYFLFNTENHDLTNISNDDKVASYITKRQDKMETKILWCDEISEKWYDQEIISEIHKNNKILYGMSLEVVKTCNESEILREWGRLIDLGIDGICTKFPEKLMRFVKEGDLN